MYTEPVHCNNTGLDTVSFEFPLVEFVSLEKIIRNGEQPDSPTLLVRYLELGDIWIKQYYKPSPMSIYIRILALLLDTICDSCVAKHWRELCLDYSYRPLSAMKGVAVSENEKQELRRQYQKFRTLSHYFC